MTKSIEWKTALHVVKTIAEDSFGGWEMAFVEAIKNSVEAGATRIHIELPMRDVLVAHGDQVVVVEDDGRGMSFEELENQYCTFGCYKPSHRGTGKIATFVVAGRVEIETWREGKEYRLAFSTAEVIDARGGQLLKTSVQEVPSAHSGSGTRLTLKDFTQPEAPPSADSLSHVILRHFYHLKSVQFFINGSPFTATEHATLALKADRQEVKGVGVLSIEVLVAKQGVGHPGVVVYHDGQIVYGPGLLGLTDKGYRGDAQQAASRILGRVDLVAVTPAPTTAGLWTLTPQFKAVEKWVGEQLEAVVDQQTSEVVEGRVERWLKDERTRRFYARLGEDERASAHRILLSRARKSTAGTQAAERIIARLVCHSLATNDALQVVLDVLDDASLDDVESFSQLFKGKDKWTLRQVTRAASLVKHHLKALEDLETCVGDYTKNEAAIHEILEENPWIIADDYHSFRSNRQIQTTLKKHFNIDTDDPKAKCRPDFFFVLGDVASSSLEQSSRFLFIELKGPDQPLSDEHQNQVLRDARTFMKSLPGFSFCVLIGTELSANPPDPEVESKGIYTFRSMTYQQVINRARFRLNYIVEGVQATGAEELARRVLIAQVEGLASTDGREAEKDGGSGTRGSPFRRVTGKKLKRFVNAVPLYDLRVSAGGFSVDQVMDTAEAGANGCSGWVAPKTKTKLERGLFVAQVFGESMNRTAPNGAWCLFRAHPADPEGRPVLVQHRDVADPDFGGRYTLKVFAGEYKEGPEGSRLRHRVTLKPDSTDPSYQPMVLVDDPGCELTVIAEMVEVLEVEPQHGPKQGRAPRS